MPWLGALSKQTATVFAAGLVAGLSTLYLPSLLSPSIASLRSLLFRLYPLVTHSLAIGLWWATRHQPSLSTLSSLRADSPLRYSYLVLLSTLCFCQLLFAPHIAASLWAPSLVYVGQLLAHLPLIVHCTLATATALHVPTHSVHRYTLALVSLLVCVGCAFPYVGSEHALSRRDAGLAWYVLRLVVEVCYTLMMTATIIDDDDGGGDSGSGQHVSNSGQWMIAHAVRIALWAALAYVCRLYENGHTKLL